MTSQTTPTSQPTGPESTGPQSTGSAPSLVVFGVADLAAATRFWTGLLGVEPYADSPYYVGYRTGAVEIGLDPNAGGEGTSPVVYWTVEDLDARVDALVAAGATVRRPPSDVGGGRRVALLADLAGNPVGLREG